MLLHTAECTIVIVTWNAWDHLFRCLDALRRQTQQGFKVVIVDNGVSTEEQVSRLREYSWVRYVHNTQNLGFAAANNQAIEFADGSPWIMLLNPDAIPEPDWFRLMMAAAREHPDVSMFGSRLIRADEPTILDGDGDSYHVSGMPWRQGHGLPVPTTVAKPREVFAPCAAAALYRREALLAVGGFDEDFFCYVEDVDLGFRLRLAGHCCLQVSSAVVRHVGSVSVGRHSGFYIFYSHRNLVWAYVKNMPWPLFWLFLPLHLSLNIASLILFSVQGKSIQIFRAKKAALSGLPRMWRKRRQIQAQRTSTTLDILRVLDRSFFPMRDRQLKYIRHK